jgi:hypothetical protein
MSSPPQSNWISPHTVGQHLTQGCESRRGDHQGPGSHPDAPGYCFQTPLDLEGGGAEWKELREPGELSAILERQLLRWRNVPYCKGTNRMVSIQSSVPERRGASSQGGHLHLLLPAALFPSNRHLGKPKPLSSKTEDWRMTPVCHSFNSRP